MIVDFKDIDERNPATIGQLSPLELTVISLASGRGERGPRSTSGHRSPFVKALLQILGYRAVRPLANARLEAVRQLAATLYHHGDYADATTAQFLAAGLTACDIEAVRATVRKLPVKSRRRSLFCSAAIVASTVVLAGCATAGKDRTAERDPLQTLNRGVWKVNRGLDTVVIKPASTAYRKVVPKGARRGVTGIFANLTEPWSAVNNLLQLKPGRAGRNIGRFAVNTTIGIGGIHDSATKMGIRTAPEDLGQTLASWGVGGGPYLVLPLFGPSTLRDGVGKIGSSFADPVSLTKSEANAPSAVGLGSTVLETVDGRAQMTEQGVDTMLNTSPDPYVTARSTYLQQRRSEILNQDAPGEPKDQAPPATETITSSDKGPGPSALSTEDCSPLSGTEVAVRTACKLRRGRS
jgi:phospholipid-binding lipoprotein MlaA